jgi:signal transduction histidine kinase
MILWPNISFQRTVRIVEWAILLASLLQNWFGSYLHDKSHIFIISCAYVAVFFVLNFFSPVNKPFWQCRGYVAIQIILLLTAMPMQLTFDVLPYFILTKSCFILPRREVIFAAIVLGVGYTSIFARVLPESIKEAIARVQSGQAPRIYNLQVILASSTISYIVASLFAISFGFVLIAERRSRQKSEELAQQIEVQAAALERTRISREIHDSLGHSLTTLDVQLELAQRLADRDHAESLAALEIARQLASQCLQDVRLSVQTIRQSEFDLNHALQSLAEQGQQFHSLRICLNLQFPKLPAQIEHQLFCIAREALTNVHKHAQAKVVYLDGYTTMKEVFLEVKDDGIGIKPNSIETDFGLRGMQERAELLNGHFKIHSAENQGTFIQVRIPQ